jgi:hypothetical protein
MEGRNTREKTKSNSKASSRKNWLMPDPAHPPTPPERKKQIVAAHNILFGAAYFLIFSLPEGWGIVRSYLEPDVHSTVGRGGLVWVEAGQADQIVFNRHRRIAFDLMIQIKRGKYDTLDLKDMQVFSQGSGIVGGHPASYFIGEVNQGFIKKKSYKTLRICFFCPELQHTLFLHFTGKCQETDLREIFDSLADLECH